MKTGGVICANVVLLFVTGATEARDTNNLYSEFNIFLRNYDRIWLNIHQIMMDHVLPGTTGIFDALGVYHTTALLGLGSNNETQEQLLDALNYFIVDHIMAGAALLNQTVPTYSQFNFESYIDLTKKAQLNEEFDRILTRYIPLVTKRQSNDFCKSCNVPVALSFQEDDDYKNLERTDNHLWNFKQGICFTSYSDYEANWILPFNAAQTSEVTFFNDDGSTQMVTMMSKIGLDLFIEDNTIFNMRMLTIPFSTLDCILLLMMPNDGRNIADFARHVYSDLDTLVENLVYRQAATFVKIVLPKFETITNLDLLDAYPYINVKQIFTQNAETAILKNSPNTNMNNFKSKIHFTMNEKGIKYESITEAGNVDCDEVPKRIVPELRQNPAQSPFAVPVIAALTAGVAQETVQPGTQRVVEFNATSPFVFTVITTDFTVLTIGSYQGH